jgi:BirA family biotin operon repressor/biotin-[acetyl-CoA-carboxylase] ligase
LAHRAVSNSTDAPFIELQTVDSTNKYAMELIHADMAQRGLAIFAHSQTAGKGQRGKNWLSEPGCNIALSVIFRPQELQLHEQFYLSAAMASAVHQFFSGYAGYDETKIKWPNDLYWRDRKAGGMLIESLVGNPVSAGSSWQWAVVGIGININQTSFPEDLPNPVSLKQITGKNFDTVILAKELCSLLQKEFDYLISGKKQETIKLYNQHLYKQGQTVKLKIGNKVFETTIHSVTPQGRLITSDSISHEFNFGEVEWVTEKVR